MELDSNEPITLIGVVEEIVYYNEDNGYAVCYVQTQDTYTAVVGYLPLVAVGESVTFSGSWTFHPEYGSQFKADYYEKNMPKEKADILKYLSSGIIKGVRQATAEKIVSYFGETALDVIAKTPEKLAEIHGISKKKAFEIGQSYAMQIGVRDVVLFLQKFGVTPAYAVKVYKRYGCSSVEVIKKNPYILAEEVYGIGFKTADKIAMSMGIEKNSEVRIQAAIQFCLWEGTMSGHTYLPRPMLEQQTAKLTGADEGEIGKVITGMLFSDKLVHETTSLHERIYLPALFHAEKYTAEKLLRFAETTYNLDIEVESVINEVERHQNMSLTEQQRQAVISAVQYGAVIITGGPGTGKTTIIKAIIAVMDKLEKEVMLAAPTGRAAKRMTEMCGMEARTIHRLLEAGYSDESESMQFSKNEDVPLECDALIIDEMSMVDILLMQSLLKAVKNGTRLIFVGDSDQLPSVGAGQVLQDMISSGCIPVFALTEIFRQARESMIVVNAHKINHGEYPDLNGKGSDFFLVRRENAQDIVSSIVDLCINRLPKTYGYDPMSQIQVLTPARKSVTGVNILNEKLQAALNPPAGNKKEKPFKNIVFREGDKVMQIKNNYDTPWTRIEDGLEGMGIFNGDIGFIQEIDFVEETVKIYFDDKECDYPFASLDEITLAYAMTVHKSQGSEFDVIVMPMYPCAPMLQNRNIFYTAVTRARKLVVLVGRNDCIHTMVDNINQQSRCSGLLDKMAGGL